MQLAKEFNATDIDADKDDKSFFQLVECSRDIFERYLIWHVIKYIQNSLFHIKKAIDKSDMQKYYGEKIHLSKKYRLAERKKIFTFKTTIMCRKATTMHKINLFHVNVVVSMDKLNIVKQIDILMMETIQM